jgi:hypothetical protein
MTKVMIVVALTLAVVAMMGPAWADSRELNCWVSDPTGDATAGQPYQDIVTAGITSKSGVFTFTMNLRQPFHQTRRSRVGRAAT